jgi:hypothetical protein
MKLNISRPLAEMRPHGRQPAARPVSADELQAVMAKRRARTPALASVSTVELEDELQDRGELPTVYVPDLPIWHQPPEVADVWWAAVAAERGAKLADWDRRGGHPDEWDELQAAAAEAAAFADWDVAGNGW